MDDGTERPSSMFFSSADSYEDQGSTPAKVKNDVKIESGIRFVFSRRVRLEQDILRLFPLPAIKVPLNGLYLAHDLRRLQRDLDQLYMLANFITSLDGRISIEPRIGRETIPDQIANARDWRLFQELAIQADVLLTSGRYLRDYAAGETQDILRVYDDPNLADLKDWRIEHGLQPYPDLAVISGSMKFPVPETLARGDRNVLVFTTRSADPTLVKNVENRVDEVVAVGDESVDGRELKAALAALGYGVVYSTAGPQVHRLLLAAGVLDRLYLTLTGKLLGGKSYSSIVEGAFFDPVIVCRLSSLYYDTAGFGGSGQLFMSYDVTPESKQQQDYVEGHPVS
jgi:riboflavin biosynthesis pyrimidine reductase